MTYSDSAAAAASPSLPVNAPLAPKKENNVIPLNTKLAELNESRAELLNRITNLKQDLQNWRSKLDTQVKVYREELTDLKVSLNTEVEQLRSEFQQLRSTLQQQQEDVTASLGNLGLRDVSGETNDSAAPEGGITEEEMLEDQLVEQHKKSLEN